MTMTDILQAIYCYACYLVELLVIT